MNEDFKKWVLGVVAPLLPLFWGIQGLILRTSSITSRNSSWRVVGAEAVTVSLCYIALAIFLHFFFFWEDSERLVGCRDILVIASILLFLISAGYFVYLDFRG